MRQDHIIVLTRVNVFAHLSIADNLLEFHQSLREVSLDEVGAEVVCGLRNVGTEERGQAMDEFLVDDGIGDLGFHELGDSFTCFASEL